MQQTPEFNSFMMKLTNKAFLGKFPVSLNLIIWVVSYLKIKKIKM
jgi:hypothetical protein